jgi:hypothetical protein
MFMGNVCILYLRKKFHLCRRKNIAEGSALPMIKLKD